jgi:hypothetical protein
MIKVKTNASTIPELVVVMIISSILAIGVWSGYRFLTFQFNAFNERNNQYQELLILDYLLKSDFVASELITADNSRTLDLIFNDGLKVIYLFENDVIVRTQNDNVDSFKMVVNKPIVMYQYINANMTLNVRSLGIDVMVNNRMVSLNYIKKYDCLFYIEHLRNFQD